MEEAAIISDRQNAGYLESTNISISNRGDDSVLEGVTIGDDENGETSSDSEVHLHI